MSEKEGRKTCEGLRRFSSPVLLSALLHMLAGVTELILSFTGYSLMRSCAAGHRAEQRWPEDSHDPASFSESQSSSNHSAALLEPASLPV